MYSRILVPIDDSPTSQRGLDEGLELALVRHTGCVEQAFGTRQRLRPHRAADAFEHFGGRRQVAGGSRQAPATLRGQ